uniref:Retrovirus-related Pol polyprotein from transposon TNT 1-94 n=1 Tax=Tanacetum cinerariifolium TaxID=118510 RepID=A0A6L2JTV6_TANCI|nr:retrovirus-related Pol polyprotein from transposon TNT 1-94 [Tanacetum cinerariifolium]
MIIKKYSEIVKAKVERKSLTLKAKKESSDEECLTSGCEDEDYAIAVKDFKKFFKRKGKFMRQPRNDKKTFQRSRDDKNGKSDKNALDATTRIILLENVQNHKKIRTKEPSSEVLGVIMMKKIMRRRLGHANMCLIQSLASIELLRKLPKLKFDQHFCDAYKIGKQAYASHKAKTIVSKSRCLELLHMDLFGPSVVWSYRGNRYTLVIIDDYSRNLKVHKMIIKKYSKIVKAKAERKSLALKAKKESSDEECLTSRCEDEDYTIAVRDFKKFFKRKGKFMRQPRNDKKTFQRSRDDKNGKSDRKCFRCNDPNHLIGECPKPPKDKNQRAFVGGSWSDNDEEDDEKVKNETCLVAQHQVRDYRYFYQLSHSEFVGIEKKAVCFSLRLLKLNSDRKVITMKMGILLEPSSNKLLVERFDTIVGNLVKEILLKLNLHDHSILKDGGEESKDLTSLSLNKLIRNLKVHKMIIKKYSEIVKAKVKRKSLALKAKKESSDEECLTSGCEDEEYVMAVRDFKKFFKRKGKFIRQPRNDKKTFQISRDDKNGKSDRKCFRCNDPNHLIGECPKPPKDKNQRAFVGDSWSDSDEEDDEKVKNETCLVAQASSEVCFESSYFSNENSSMDDLVLDN